MSKVQMSSWLPHPLPPFFPGEVLEFLQFMQVVELVMQAPHALPGHEADVLPLLPQCPGLWVLDLGLLTHAGFAVRENIGTLVFWHTDEENLYHLQCCPQTGETNSNDTLYISLTVQHSINILSSAEASQTFC